MGRQVGTAARTSGGDGVMAMVGATAMVAMAAPPLLALLAVLVEVVVARRKVERYEGKKVGRLAYQSTY